MMHNPPSAGEILREDVINALNISIADAAKKIGISRVLLSSILNENSAISPFVASQLEAAGFSTARFWLSLQSGNDKQKFKK